MRRALDRTVLAAAGAGALLCAAVFCGVLYAILARGLAVVDTAFLTQDIRLGGAAGGIAFNILGTLILVATAAVVCAPLALGTALAHGFYLRRHRGARRALELVLYGLNGVPSILFGILGLILFVQMLGWGKSWLAGGILLALVMLPTVAVHLMERIGAVPQAQIEAAAGLGLSEAQVVRSVVLPQTAGALLTGLVLGLARAAGETAPILFTATVFAGAGVPTGVRDSPVLSLPYHVFVLAQDSFDPGASARVWGAASVLLLLVVALNLVVLPLRGRAHDEARHG